MPSMKQTLSICHILSLFFYVQASCGTEVNPHELAGKGDIEGLTRLLRHRDGVIRSSAAVELSNAIRSVKTEKRLTPLVRQHLESSLEDPYQTVREHAGRSFQHSMRNISHQPTLQSLVPILADSLHSKEVELKRRRFAAVMLAELMPRIENANVMRLVLPEILDSTLNDSDEQTQEYSGRAVQISLRKITYPDALSEAAKRLTITLKDKDSKRRQYAAIQLSAVVPKITDQKVIRHIAPTIEKVAQSDPDPTIREYMGRAARHLQKKAVDNNLRVSN
jgi:hypothetical protein